MPHEEQVAVGQEGSPTPVRDWRELRRALIVLISEGINMSERRYTEASDLLAEYVTALDIAKGDASHGDYGDPSSPHPTPEHGDFVKVRRGNVHITRWPVDDGVRTACGGWYPFHNLTPASGEESEKCLACWTEF